MLPRQETPLALIATEAQRARIFHQRQEQERIDYHTQKLQELVKYLSDYNLFPEVEFVHYPTEGMLSNTSRRHLLLVSDDTTKHDALVLTPEGKIQVVKIGINNSFFYCYGAYDYLQGDEFVQSAGHAYAKILETTLKELTPDKNEE